MTKRRIFFLGLPILFVIHVFTAKAQTVFDFNNQCIKAYGLLFDLRFTEARQILESEKKLNRDNGIPVYLEHYLLFLKAFISEQQEDFVILKSHQEVAMELFDRTEVSSPFCLFAKADVSLFTGFVRLKNSEYIAGALSVRRAYKYLEENARLYPDFTPGMKGMGLMHAFIGAVPENYKWLLKLAGMNGNIQQGIGELEKMYVHTQVPGSSYHFMHREISYIYFFSKQHLENNQESIFNEIAALKDDHSPLGTFFRANVYYYTGKNEEVLALLNKLEASPESYTFPYLTYMRGIAKLNALDLSAADEFNQYISLYKGKSFIKAGLQKLAWIALMGKDTLSYKQRLGLILKQGNDFTDEDKQAQKEATENKIPNVLLLKARLLFDGGRFKESLNLLAGKSLDNFPSLKDKLELTYRLGRIYDRLSMTENAKSLYLKTIQNGNKYPYYFAANSCLHLAQIYENANDPINAEKYFKECLALRNHEYQNSIDQKAKAGLNRLGKNTTKDF